MDSTSKDSSDGMRIILVDGTETSKPPRKSTAKLFHKKSRTGCQLCRARRCDEAKPVCRHCQRLGQSCIYDRQGESGTQSQESSPSNWEVDHFFVESEARRQLELRLLTHYLTTPDATIAIDDASREMWSSGVCRMALHSEALRYSVHLTAALHMKKQGDISGPEATVICNAYLDKALKMHQQDVSTMNEKNADFICMTSTMLRVYSFFHLQDRPHRPYTPPLEWLRMGETSSFVFKDAWDAVKGNPNSVAVRQMQNMNQILAGKVGKGMIDEFRHLTLRETPYQLAEPWDGEIADAYESTVDSLGGILNTIKAHEPLSAFGRQLIVFPLLVHPRFVGLVEEQRPRALVVLAYYFALLNAMRDIWWVGDAGLREVHAIYNLVADEWRSHLAWPMQMVGRNGLLLSAPSHCI